jgi:hypothetical protein
MGGAEPGETGLCKRNQRATPPPICPGCAGGGSTQGPASRRAGACPNPGPGRDRLDRLKGADDPEGASGSNRLRIIPE